MHGDIHAHEIGNQPNAPNHNTKPIEVCLGDSRTFKIGPQSPKYMNKHQDNGNYSGDRMQLIVLTRYNRNMRHQRSSGNIKDKTKEEKQHMPSFQQTLNAFAPNTN